MRKAWPALLDALAAWDPSSYVQVDDVPLHSKTTSPEHECIKRDMFRKLSKDAKMVIEIVLSSPSDFASGLFHTVTEETSINKLHKYLYERYFWSKTKRQEVFKEIKKAVDCI